MTDIVERLRTSASQAGYPKHYIYDEAADEIERLREEGAEAAVMSNRANNRATSLQMEVYYLKAEIERLRKDNADLLILVDITKEAAMGHQERAEELRAALRDIARQPEGDEETAQAVARAALAKEFDNE